MMVNRLSTAGFLALAALLLSQVLLLGDGTLALRNAHASCLAAHAGRDGNGLCCNPEGGTVCASGPLGLAGCSGPLPYQCSCDQAGPNTFCQVLLQEPRKHDVCQAPTDDPEESNCALTQTHCWTWLEGDCDHDGGPFSILGLCWTCGCKVHEGALPQPEGARNVCVPGSNGC